ncbi:hypothetical protein CYK37_11995 [Mesorhizobium loti]|nr:nuclear transport factor 2 family protein [Mesorhizobium loti]PLP59188.1 hypothetical protein CYK37_11995 [Mesorhizobium loti]
METSIKKFFERYVNFFNQALGGNIDGKELATLYASDFIAASPKGVMTGRNNDKLKRTLAHGYAHYREIGTKDMRIRDVRVSPIDDHHCVAHVAWAATYARDDQPDISINFEVHYLMQKVDGEPKIFGWIAGDEQELLSRHGIG